MRKFTSHKWWVLTILLTAPLLAIAAGVPNMFKAGDVISSAQVNDNFKNLADRVTALEASPSVNTYVRWGRTACPSGASPLYTGWAAGGAYNHTGGAARTVCLHDTPQWLSYDDNDQNGALLYGTEFQMAGHGLAPLAGLHDRDAQCVVCEVKRSAQIMIPGRTSCPAGWTMEYNGYLMGTYYHQQNRSDLVCVDANPEATGSSANQDGNLWYPTEAECGSLPCPNGGYVQNREITCAVCTK